MSNVLKEAKRLHALGFAIHFLRPRSKIPVNSGWTTGPRLEWAKLKEQYRVDYNLGVRLGICNRFHDSSHLGVIDCDVKSEDPKHLHEMYLSLKTFLRKANFPTVASGRGNGSAHYYFRSSSPKPKQGPMPNAFCCTHAF